LISHFVEFIQLSRCNGLPGNQISSQCKDSFLLEKIFIKQKKIIIRQIHSLMKSRIREIAAILPRFNKRKNLQSMKMGLTVLAYY